MEKKISVLIVDDNVSLGKTLSFVLGRKGYTVANAKDGTEAIANVKERPYDITYKPLDIEKTVALIERARETKHGLLIMVVDDDPGTCITLKNILSKQSYKVGIAHTGEEAVAMAHEKAYDIILIDMKLPTINGLETYLAIKKVNPEAIAIMMTAYRQEMADLVEEALNNHAYTCFYKPLDMKEVLRLIKEVEERKYRAG